MILVLGGGNDGAREWAALTPNLLNVAVSRAKDRLYVIGDRSKWEAHQYFDVLAKKLPPMDAVILAVQLEGEGHGDGIRD